MFYPCLHSQDLAPHRCLARYRCSINPNEFRIQKAIVTIISVLYFYFFFFFFIEMTVSLEHKSVHYSKYYCHYPSLPLSDS